MKQSIVFIVLLISYAGLCQESLEQVLDTLNNETIPYIYVDDLTVYKNEVVLLDARERKEYEVSHLKDAIFVGYQKFKIKSVLKTISDKNQDIVVYCSLGVRSEDIAEQLKKAGYTNVWNLYGGIFEWKNKNCPVYNFKNKETDSVHAFDDKWGKWLKKGIKVYE